ncbi:enoyl-CoA hydratase-related protein [Sphingomonas sp. CFBP 13720]|uniref:enoyl-CoA hydratase-related protein n=1 Tax=Sphingomonas sp. CFBP 13720 TaxID=2775302 RepID=UPI001785ED39|nr:enoyl-CoA hydratase-related protein [Sphingomonas sp. CFBP 13720]MBD8678855.1 enoyl-CoA hydratase/isomerase family protein [Sphingomonas sp. CFBP 13720]
MAEPIRVMRDGDVLRLTLTRPDRLNAAPPDMFDAIRAALAGMGDARAVLIAGDGRGFCAGADIAGAGDAAAIHAALTDHYHPTIQAIADLAIPVVSAVHGPAAGIGCSLALAADFCVATQDAYFLQAFVQIGLVPDGGASWMLPRLIGRARATRMMMLGERIPAQTALDWGMIHAVVDGAALEDEALALARRLAAGPTVALGLMRRTLTRALGEDLPATLAREADAQSRARDTDDAVEGASAFLGKRTPRFRGR